MKEIFSIFMGIRTSAAINWVSFLNLGVEHQPCIQWWGRGWARSRPWPWSGWTWRRLSGWGTCWGSRGSTEILQGHNQKKKSPWIIFPSPPISPPPPPLNTQLNKRVNIRYERPMHIAKWIFYYNQLSKIEGTLIEFLFSQAEYLRFFIHRYKLLMIM